MAISKLGILCLLLAFLIIIIIDLRVLIALGLLYYSYKILYKKEKLRRLDRIAIMVLISLLILEIFLSFYFANSYLDYLNSTGQSQIISGS
jgi:energy-coupling factor transporter transmembrane protein EcfT